MDLLGSIMKKMEKPPGLDEKEKQRLKRNVAVVYCSYSMSCKIHCILAISLEDL